MVTIFQDIFFILRNAVCLWVVYKIFFNSGPLRISKLDFGLIFFDVFVTVYLVCTLDRDHQFPLANAFIIIDSVVHCMVGLLLVLEFNWFWNNNIKNWSTQRLF